MFRDPNISLGKKKKKRFDPGDVKRPEPPQHGVGAGGKIGTTLSASMMKNLVRPSSFSCLSFPFLYFPLLSYLISLSVVI